ncbi:MAG: AMP-binding protein, partial [Rhodospirillales bacterium]|nr:AMP-binding protein [Rhodospirillales bacterium]
MSKAQTIRDLLAAGAAKAEAIGAPGRRPLTYEALRAHADKTVKALNALGVGRNDRVAIVLPNGPEMAAAFVCIGCGATTAPLNPAYRADEFRFYLSDLNAKALIVEEGADSPALAVARELNVPIVALQPLAEDAAGLFELVGPSQPGGVAKQGGPAQPSDIALVLHTSGTTSRPKIVPLSQQNVCASAGNIGRTLALVPGDRCLNIMPLFHIHGLMAAVLSSLA